MEHVDKKPKVAAVDSSKENASSGQAANAKPADMRQMLLDGSMMDFALAPPPLRETSSGGSVRSYSSHFQDEGKQARKPWEKRITELLDENLEHRMKLDATKPTESRKMEGDIPSLCLHSSFFVEGVRIGWPFPVIMPPQRQMALHLIKALKNRRHVVLESPTGTGKSAAILCSALAWQRYHQKLNPPTGTDDGPKTPRIIYCSRTHSQVAQMIASLRKTPYRPRMAVLGSRERLCIHKKIRNRGTPEDEDDNEQRPVNVNLECRTRVGNTELMRKRIWQSNNAKYDDDNPPTRTELDTAQASERGGEESEEGPDWIDTSRAKDKPCCPHYRQLGTSRTANMAYNQLVPKRTCCNLGGERTKQGSHDIEDLIEFGKDPYVTRGVAVYRAESTGSFGMTISKSGNDIQVAGIIPGGAVDAEGSICKNDTVVRINGEDTDDKSIDELASMMRATEDPLLLDLTSDTTFGADDTGYSEHSPCPYYIARALAKSGQAELIFCPYNYILDPSIRKSLDIDLQGTICVLDEGHNVESTLRESGSGKYSEIELCEIVEMLLHFSSASKTYRNTVETDGEKKDLSDLAHGLLLFVEQLVTFLMEAKIKFEQSPGKNGAKNVIAEWERFHTPDNTEFEMTYDGPSGRGERGKAVGCRTFFDRMSLTCEKAETLQKYAEGLESHIRSQQEWQQTKYATLVDNLTDLITRFSYALEQPEFYYVASVVKANGNLEFAAGMSSGGLRPQRDSGFKRKPKKWPSISRDGVVDRCFHPECRNATNGPHFHQGGIRHGTYLNGNEQPWEAVLVLELLAPAKFMKALTDQCHTVVLASGSLAPIKSLCGELGLAGDANEQERKPAAARPNPTAKDKPEEAKALDRLQVHPPPLEANHVINLEKQLLALSIGHFEDGSPLTMTYSHYKNPEFITKLGGAIASVIESVPTGGVLVFLPSYSLLRKCVKQWNPYNARRGGGWGNEDFLDNEGRTIWDRFEASKGKVIVEPSSGGQNKFEEARDDYADTIRETGKCILLAVFRGKMSEGISFNDENARAVICVGIPFPMKSMQVKAKIDFNKEQRLLNKRDDILSGDSWYCQQAYRAIAQALGRCIRHAADYGTVVLMDSRHCDDGEPLEGEICRAHKPLPKWMRYHVRNLSKRHMGDSYGKSIPGSWRGLQTEMARFFEQAPVHSEQVLAQQREHLQRAMNRDRTSQERQFDQKTGGWTPTTQQSSSHQEMGPTQDETEATPLSAQITPTQTQGTPSGL